MKSAVRERKTPTSTRIPMLSAFLLPKMAVNDASLRRVGAFPSHILFPRHISPVSIRRSASEHQVRQFEQLSAILGQPLVAGLAMTEQVLHHVKHIFQLRLRTGLGLLQGFERHSIRTALRQLPDRAAPGCNLPRDLLSGCRRTPLCTGVSRLDKGDSFFSAASATTKTNLFHLRGIVWLCNMHILVNQISIYHLCENK